MNNREIDPPLKDIRVLDLTQYLTGPFCSRILADLGAEVIKIEIPIIGDKARTWGPPFLAGESVYFLGLNRNKKSLTLNLKTKRGKQILYNLIKKCDVFLENFRPGVAHRLRIDYETIQKINPNIIYCSTSGFGQTGPHRNRPAYDITIQGISGLMSITGEPDRPPVRIGVSLVDLIGSVYSVIAILCSIIARKKSGGQRIDISLLDGAVSWLTYMAELYIATGITPKKLGSAHPTIVPYQCFQTKDVKYIVIAIGNDILWTKLCKVIGLEEMADNPKFATNPMRVRNRDELISILNGVFLTKTRDQWLETLVEIVPCGPVCTMDEVLSNPQIIQRDMLVELKHPTAGKIKQIGIPMKFSKTPGKIEAPPPLLGQHTEEILQDMLGMSKAEITQLRSEGVV